MYYLSPIAKTFLEKKQKYFYPCIYKHLAVFRLPPPDLCRQTPRPEILKTMCRELGACYERFGAVKTLTPNPEYDPGPRQTGFKRWSRTEAHMGNCE
jgi:hypothetical protein